MRPQITYPKSLKRALNYHEKKVGKGTAELLHAENFLKLPGEMNFYDKYDRFNDLIALSEADTKLIHISLNFHPSEKERLSKDLFVQVANEFMEKMGFGSQPYLVYQHDDAGHPHVHILSSLIKEDGKRINTHNMARNLSEPIRKEMETRYGFVPASKKEQQQEQPSQLAVTAQKVKAGKSATMRSITNVLDHVLDRYNYTSLQELNAILRTFNVKADRGAENGRIYRNRGLTYSAIDEQGKTVTKPIKASAFYSKPTLDYIEAKCKANEKSKDDPKPKKRLRTAIDWAMQSKPDNLQELARLLHKESVALVVRRNEAGRVYGLTYVDHKEKRVFNGSDLGKEYSAKRMVERMSTGVQQQSEHHLEKEQSAKATSHKQHPKDGQPGKAHPQKSASEKKEPSLPVDRAAHQAQEVDTSGGSGKGISRVIEEVIDVDGSSAINKEMLTEEQRKKKKNFEKKWEF
jgi:hypothetical protein